jgi:hypothetical protein|tara:strand:+ start:962 stop:1459 length:498 start_codon:yes stop_codon:yes gene_type:complete
MKKLLFLIIILVSISACNNNSGNGFVNDSDLKFYIGSNSSVELFKVFDSAWKNLDYKLMKTMIADSISFEFHDGKIATNADEFIEIIKGDVTKRNAEGNSYTWTTDYALSVDLTPSKDGEWVNAGFTSVLDFPQDSIDKRIYNDWYFFNKGKLELWYQAIRELKE